MQRQPSRPGPARFSALVLGFLLLGAAPASAQWTRVTNLPVTDVFALFTNADTLIAGVDTAAYVSTDAGLSWKRTSRPAPDAVVLDGLWVRNGRLYGGTFGKGVFVSDNLGDTWQAYNEGLVGGIFDSQLSVSDLQVRGDSLYAATLGAGVYVRGFAAGSTWHHFGEVFEPLSASNVNDVALGGNRLLASASGNGIVFVRDPGDAEWTPSFLDNAGLSPGVSAVTSTWTGTAWLVGTNAGPLRSPTGVEPWSFTDVGLGALSNAAFALRPGRAFAAFTTAHAAVIETSVDDGVTWSVLDSLPFAFVFQMVPVGSNLYAGRTDGLWRRSVASVSVPAGSGASGGLAFAVLGAQPAAGSVRLRFVLAQAGPASIDVFDVRGRRVGEHITGWFAAGPHEVSWNAEALGPGVYAARLSAGDRHAAVRIVHVR